MNNCKVIFNRSLKDYKKKYRHRDYILLNYTKKEVEDFDKLAKVVNKNLLLKGRRWWFTKEDQCYHEIPRPIRWTWFRNLNVGVQTLTCVLLVGAIGGGAYGTYYLLSQNKSDVIKPYIDEELKDDVTIDSFIVGDKSTKITLKANNTSKEIKSVTVKAGKDELVENTDFTFDLSSQVVTISNESIKAHGSTIIIKPTLGDKVEFDGKVKDKDEWDSAIKHAFSNSDDANVSFTIGTSTYSYDGCLYQKLAKVSNGESGASKSYSVYNSLGIRNNGQFKIRKDFRGLSEKSYYISEIIPGYFETDIQSSSIISLLTLFDPSYFTFDEATKSYSLEDGYFIKFTKYNDKVVLDSLKVKYDSLGGDMTFAFKYGGVKSTDIETVTINDVDNYKKAKMTSKGKLVGENFGKNYTIPEGVNSYTVMVTHFKVEDLVDIKYDSSERICVRGYNDKTQIRLLNRKETFLKQNNDSYALFLDGVYEDVTPEVEDEDGTLYFKYPADIFEGKTDVVLFNEIGFSNGDNILNAHIELTYPTK